ncbi:MAG: hypothetical protein HQL66_13085 [Magnetococcales bacterium]|nr:hypothetical protein [Magnetococcales bacterium]
MPTFIGLKNSSFDPEAYANEVAEGNTGPDPDDITPANILTGWRAIKEEALSDEFAVLIESSSLFVRSQP